MSLLNVLHFPDPRLRTRAAPVDEVDETVRQLIDDMFETMYAAPGIGLAATQVNVHRRVIVIDLSEDKDQPLCLINLVIKVADGIGAAFSLDAEGLLAVCIQHEMDHLEGKLFIDYLSEMKRGRIRKRLEKRERQTL